MLCTRAGVLLAFGMLLLVDVQLFWVEDGDSGTPPTPTQIWSLSPLPGSLDGTESGFLCGGFSQAWMEISHLVPGCCFWSPGPNFSRWETLKAGWISGHVSR